MRLFMSYMWTQGVERWTWITTFFASKIWMHIKMTESEVKVYSLNILAPSHPTSLSDGVTHRRWSRDFNSAIIFNVLNCTCWLLVTAIIRQINHLGYAWLKWEILTFLTFISVLRDYMVLSLNQTPLQEPVSNGHHCPSSPSIRLYMPQQPRF